ncbi:amidohydrolase family protein [Nonomuraea sp. NPDC050547]|uniref:amidohydrolase family protein n=1 Tax=unclassified Nonomuraea TaxID=2593643 RepID=UPI0037B34F0E
MSDNAVIDMAGVVLDAESWESYLSWFAADCPNYLRLFGRRFCGLAGVGHAAYQKALERGPDEVVRLLLSTGRLDVDIDGYVEELAAGGVALQVIHGGMTPLRSGGLLNDRAAAFARRHPDRLRAWAGLSLRDEQAALKEMRRCVGDLGMGGVSVTHFTDVADPLSAASRAVYAEAERLGVPVWIHAGHNLSPRVPVDHCAWRQLDAIARAHPDLVIVAGHGGWPWMMEMVALCQRHPNVYLEFSTHRPLHMAAAGSGWEPLLAHGRATIRNKVLFGSVGWVHEMSAGELADEVRALPLDEGTVRRWLYTNATRVLGTAA